MDNQTQPAVSENTDQVLQQVIAKPEPLGWFETMRWLQQVAKVIQQWMHAEGDLWGQKLDRGLRLLVRMDVITQTYYNQLIEYSGDPWWFDEHTPKFLDTIIDPRFREMVDEELAKLGYNPQS